MAYIAAWSFGVPHAEPRYRYSDVDNPLGGGRRRAAVGTRALTYDIDDAHPDIARVQGDSEYIQAVKDHVLTWRGRLDVSSDAQTFFYKYTRTLLRDGVIIRTKTWEEPIPRDHQ